MSRSDAGKMCLLVHALLILTVSSVIRTAYNNCERLPESDMHEPVRYACRP